MKNVTVESMSPEVELANLYRRRQVLDKLIRDLEFYAHLQDKPAGALAQPGSYAAAIAV